MTVQEKYELFTKGARPNRNTVWLHNTEMSKGTEEPVLVEVPLAHWNNRRQMFQKQGYSLFKPQAAVPAPVEAKKQEPKKDG